MAIAANFLGLHIYVSIAVACFHMGREHTQADLRVISRHYGNKRANAPWWCGFERRAWKAKGMLDLVLPVTIFTITLMV